MSKSKRKHLNIKDQCDIIEQLEHGSSVTSLAQKYGISKACVCAIRNRKSKIKNHASKMFYLKKRFNLKQGELPRTEKLLYKWFIKHRSKNIPITGHMMKAKAKLIHSRLHENESGFYASDGWIRNFKKRFGIRLLKITGEKLSSQIELVNPFKEKFLNMIKNESYSNCQIYNADESGLFYKSLPEKTFVLNSEKTAPGMKISKQRLTILLCCNASGTHKLKPLVIGKAANPRCFKNFELPVDYNHSKKAWMTAEIFKLWFFKSFIPQVKKFLKNKNLSQKAILLLDNAPSHPSADILKSEDGLISVVYMPPNVTPLIQPMDQNIIRITKLHYRSSLLSSILSQRNPDIIAAIKSITLKDAVINLFAAWGKIESPMILKCWKNILENQLDEEDIPLSVLRDNMLQDTNMHIEELTDLLNVVSADDRYVCEDIRNWNQDEVYECVELSDSSSSEENFELNIDNQVSDDKALEALNTALKWAENNDVMVQEQIVLRSIQQKVLSKISKKKKIQKKVTEYFVKQ